MSGILIYQPPGKACYFLVSHFSLEIIFVLASLLLSSTTEIIATDFQYLDHSHLLFCCWNAFPDAGPLFKPCNSLLWARIHTVPTSFSLI